MRHGGDIGVDANEGGGEASGIESAGHDEDIGIAVGMEDAGEEAGDSAEGIDSTIRAMGGVLCER